MRPNTPWLEQWLDSEYGGEGEERNEMISGWTLADLSDLPSPVPQFLDQFLAAAGQGFDGQLRAAVLFGSAAEGRLRATSDVNLLLVLTEFDPLCADRLREPLLAAEAAIRLRVMFLLESEIAAALEAFPEKFIDILRRRRVLLGTDPFSARTIPRPLLVARLKQVLLNLVLRLRSEYVLRGSREEQLTFLIAETAGPLRSCAATLRQLEGQPALPGREALAQFATSSSDRGWQEALRLVSEVRQNRGLPLGSAAASTVQQLIGIARGMLARVDHLT